MLFSGKCLVHPFNFFHFPVTPDFCQQLTLKFKLREAWGLRGEDGLTLKGYRYKRHPPQDIFIKLVMVAATYEVGVFLNSRSPPNTNHRGASS